MGRGPHYDGDIQAAALKLADDRTKSPSQIFGELQEMFGDRLSDPHRPGPLALRTVERWVKARRGEPSEPWTSADADPDEVAAVVEVLGAVMTESGGEIVTVSRLEASWVTKIRRTVPDMPSLVVWRFAKDYIAAARDTAHLDASLTFARDVKRVGSGAFELDRSRIKAHVGLHVERWISKPLVFWAGNVDGASAYVEEMGDHASLIQRGDRWGYIRKSPEWSWFDSDGFGRLIIDYGEKGALQK